MDEATRIRTVAEIINDIRNPLDGATQFNLNELDSCEKSDPVTMIRCLTMVTGLVQWVKCDVAFEPTLTGLLENVVSVISVVEPSPTTSTSCNDCVRY